MPRWGREPRVVRWVDDVKCYQEQGFTVERFDGFDLKKHNDKQDPYFKTFAINCGLYDGEHIDLFDLQDWFDRNRDWVNGLRAERGQENGGDS